MAPDIPTPPGASPGGVGPIGEADVLACLPGLRALLLRLTRNPETVNDLSQEVILAVILAVRAGRVREPAALAAYVHQSARNAVAIQGRRMQPVLLEELPEVESFWGERPRTPLEQCEAEEVRALARRVLAELPTERDREIVTAFYVRGESKPALMQRFALQKDQFDRVISRARGRMRDLLVAKMNSKQPLAGESARSGIPATGESEATR